MSIAEGIITVKNSIAAAAERSGRSASDITLVAVSKTHPPAAVVEAIDAGAVVFGENKVQEADEKIAVIDRDRCQWHMIGHLQSNKARKAVQLFDMIHSVDSLELGLRLDRICGEEGRASLPVLIEVDLAGEESKSGITESSLSQVIERLGKCRYLELKGLMILPPFADDVEMTRPYFTHLRQLRDELLPGGELSMGMSHDFEAAVEEGSTIVRVGTAIFGAR